MSWTDQAKQDALNLYQEFLDEIKDYYFTNENVSVNMAEYTPVQGCDGETWFQERIIDRNPPLSLEETGQILNELGKFRAPVPVVADDDLVVALQQQAAETYGNAVRHYWQQIVTNINEDIHLRRLVQAYKLLNESSINADKVCDQLIEMAKKRFNEINL